MKISIDLDGTLFAHMGFFRELMRVFQANGHEVGILTGWADHGEERCREVLREHGFPEPSFYFGRTPEYITKNGSEYKSMVIQREGIAVHFDDMDFGHPDSIRLFEEGGCKERVFRVWAVEPDKVDGKKQFYE